MPGGQLPREDLVGGPPRAWPRGALLRGLDVVGSAVPSLRRALCLLLAGAGAKLVLVALRALDGVAAGLATPWAVPALLYQEVWVALGALALDFGLTRAGAQRAGWAIYAAAALYMAANVPIARQFGTPLTWAFVEATGGALGDSIAAYVTPGNVAAVLVTLAWAAALPWLVRRPPRRVRALAIAAALVIALGPAGARRCETLGLHRNAIAALVTTRLARMTERSGSKGQIVTVPAEGLAIDLTHLAGAARGRDVIWVVLESTGARYLTLHGAEVEATPRLTRLARGGVVFESAYTSYPESIKSLYALLCGRAPAPDTAAADYAAGKAPCEPLPQLLQEQGYRTGLFHSGRFVYLGMRHMIAERGLAALHDAQTIGGEHAVSFGTDDAATATRLLRWIDESPQQPFFALYMPIAGHHPYRSPGAGTRPFAAETDLDHYRNDLFAGDEALGRLIDGLADRGRLDDVLWVIQGDHGEAFQQHPGNFAHSLFVYEENVHVPLVIVPPRAFASSVRAPQVAGAIDVAPTIAALLDVPAPASWTGRSLLTPAPGVARFFSDYNSVLLGLRTGRWKCIVEPERGLVRVFDVVDDPGETRDVAAVRAEWARACESDLLDWAARSRAAVLSSRQSAAEDAGP
ncbi:sulfatase-like hydrolase/transferase [Nannocystis sp. SCPEA4]|uniref:sulfatase-like hydrolase/transferase n=1 Tax=Nannocystis sp. SCPEA4 TaxID=2996787 RepID=UPI00226DE60B|nr:sulfatase-like hydrolase/transferase [Nannocystis sp. SCPEA4]MCY1062696.1 sulfatase-like hydrolase/transferase [Nannocystis sp. SCPEA4]